MSRLKQKRIPGSVSSSSVPEAALSIRHDGVHLHPNLVCCNRTEPWAVLLAGGDGTRLQKLTARIAGDGRPKQFCSIHGDKSLLSQTRERIKPMFRRDRTVFVVTQAHASYYQRDLYDVDDKLIIAQPQNRGTGVAMVLALLSIVEEDKDALVAFFPCDHFYSDVAKFAETIRGAIECSASRPDSIILLGAKASYAETDYGWIEPSPGILGSPAPPLMRVDRFWEKPSLPDAELLLGRGCLWNTFITVGRADTFLDVTRSEAPDVVRCLSDGLRERDVDARYQRLRSLDFSRDILMRRADRLLVIGDGDSGWADLGTPERVVSAMLRNNIEPEWMRGLDSVRAVDAVKA